MGNLQNVSLKACLNNPELKCVPKDMGEISYCYFDKEKIMNSTFTKILNVLGVVMLIGSIGGISNFGIGGALICFALGGVLIFLGIITGNYQYEEAYICSEGFAQYIYSYSKFFQQPEYDYEIAYRFDEISYLRKKRDERIFMEDDREITVVEYTFEFHLKDGKTIRHTVESGQTRLRVFLEMAERAWNSYEFDKIMSTRQQDTPISFDCICENKNQKDYIIVDEAGVRIDMEEYKGLNATTINISKDNILFGFKGLPNVLIPKYNIHNMGMFFKALNYFHKTDIGNSFEGIVSF